MGPTRARRPQALSHTLTRTPKARKLHTISGPEDQALNVGYLKEMALNYLGNIRPEDVKELAGQYFNECGIQSCAKHSMGFVCSSCSRFVCNKHIYWRLSPKPLPVCAACVLASHPELFEEEEEEEAEVEK